MAGLAGAAAAFWTLAGAGDSTTTPTGPRPDPPPKGMKIVTTPSGRTAWISAATHGPTGCPGARRAIRYYRAAYARHREAMRLPGPPELVRGGCNTARTMAAKWRELAYRMRVAAEEWIAHHFHWWEWLPANWQRVGACETGYGRAPGNFHHANSSFVSAFGIRRSIYDSDARLAGGPPWSDEHPPTPRQQYEAAVAHYRKYGDGWTCPGP